MIMGIDHPQKYQNFFLNFLRLILPVLFQIVKYIIQTFCNVFQNQLKTILNYKLHANS